MIPRHRRLDEIRASADYEVFQAAEEDESMIGRIVSTQREELEQEIAGLKAEAERVAEEARELAGEVPFCERRWRGLAVGRMSKRRSGRFPLFTRAIPA